MSEAVHSPPKTGHVIVGAGEGPCVVLAMSSHENQAFGPYGAHIVDVAARRYGASVEEDVQDAAVAYARFPASQLIRYPEGVLP